MATVADDFSGALGSELEFSNPSWPPHFGSGFYTIDQQVALHPDGRTTRNWYPMALDSPDHYASIEISAVATAAADGFAGPAVRMKDDDRSHYYLRYGVNESGQSMVEVGRFYAFSPDTWIEETLAMTEVEIVAGDRIELRVSGMDPVELRAYLNGSLIAALGSGGTVVDDSVNQVVSGNYVGLNGFAAMGSQALRLDNFLAGDLDRQYISVAKIMQFLLA